MNAQATLGPGARPQHLRLLHSAGLDLQFSTDFRCPADTDLIIVLGGDGTIHRFLPELISCRKPVLVVPCGSGNDLASSLGICSLSSAVALACDFVRGKAVKRDIDVGMITDSQGREIPFCCTAGVGLEAAAARLANRMPRWLRAHGGYLIAAMKEIFTNPKMRLTISTGTDPASGKIEQAACLLTIANTPRFGGGLPIAPAARLDDGELDCVLADVMSRAKLTRAALSLLRGTHLRLPEVHFMLVSRLRVQSDPVASVYADGEFVAETPFEACLLPRALCVCANS